MSSHPLIRVDLLLLLLLLSFVVHGTVACRAVVMA
jgi:hypothetical protein